MEASGPSSERKSPALSQRQNNSKRRQPAPDNPNKVHRLPPQPEKQHTDRTNGEGRYQKKEGANGSSPRFPNKSYQKRGGYQDKRRYNPKDKQEQNHQPTANGVERGNERFDNKSSIDTSEQSHNPALAQAIAESKRLQMIIPTGLQPEIVDQIRRIREVIPSVEEHIIYSVLEQCNFDEEKTVGHFMEANKSRESSKEEVGEMKQQATVMPGDANWINIVKKGLPNKPPQVFDRKRQKNQEHHNGHHPKKQGGGGGDLQERSTNEPTEQVDSEEIVTNLASAIEQQLRMIQQQTQMLHQMQNELLTITQTGGNEVQELSQEKMNLQQREDQLQEELRQVRERIRQIDVSLENKEKEKKERIQTLASKSAQYGILKGKTPPASQRQQQQH